MFKKRNVEDVLTKEKIRKVISDEEIFQYYTGKPVKLSEKFTSYLRKDANPTCNYFYNRNGVLTMMDHNGSFCGNCFDFVIALFNISFKDALVKIAEDLQYNKRNVVVKPVKPKKHQLTTEIIYTERNWEERDIKYWNQFNITLEILKKFKVKPAKGLWINGACRYLNSYSDPAYIYEEIKGKIKVYFPKRKNIRFYCNTNIIQGYTILPKTGDLLIITKSYKDVMTLYSYGIHSVAPQSESVQLSESLILDLKTRFKKVYCLYDFDLTGVRGANRLREYGIEPIFLTNGKLGTYNFGYKDISDAVMGLGRKRVGELIYKLKHGNSGNREKREYIRN